ncbi:MAG TPA: aldo/keto reductase [Polyangiaceae bacterium]|nr:aldo/keto reductase [Polyangiaceae bacterium]
MKTRPFTAQTSVSQLALGTWGLSGDGYGPVSEAVQEEVISRARAYGITLFETADVYGRGEMERRLGRIVGADPSVTIVTKIGTFVDGLPTRKRFDADYLRSAVERSGERLARSRVDVVLLHNPAEQTLAGDEATGALEELRREGKIGAWGVSAGSPAVARAALAKGAQVLELAYNVFTSADLDSLALSPGQVAVLARSVLAYGLLCGQWSEARVFPAGDHRAERWTTEQLRGRLKHLSALSSILGGEVSTPRAAALRFVLQNPLVSSAVIGPRSRVQLDQLVREAGQGPEYLPPSSLLRLTDQLARVGATR